MKAQLNYRFDGVNRTEYMEVSKPMAEIRIPCASPNKAGFGQIRLFLTGNIGSLLIYQDVDQPRPV